MCNDNFEKLFDFMKYIYYTKDHSMSFKKIMLMLIILMHIVLLYYPYLVFSLIRTIGLQRQFTFNNNNLNITYNIIKSNLKG